MGLAEARGPVAQAGPNSPWPKRFGGTIGSLGSAANVIAFTGFLVGPVMCPYRFRCSLLIDHVNRLEL